MVDTSILSKKFSVALNFYCTCKVIEEGFSRLYCFKERQLYERIISHIFHLISYPDTKSSSKIFDECGILLDSLWETINIGHWRDVDLFWRQLYRTICLLKSIILFRMDRVSEAILSCDMGLIMGAPFGDEIFVQDFADYLCQTISVNLPSPEEHAPFRKSDVLIPQLPNPREIPQFSAPSLEQFMELIKPGTPFIMKDVINHWPAMKKWSPSYLIRNFGERTVPVELGTSYTSELWSQKLLKLKDFISTYIMSHSDEVAYLAQYELFNHITKLKEDISLLDYCAVSDSDLITNCWFGPEGTVSPLHHDHYHNLFCQVYGHKRFILFSRHDYMHPHQHHLLENTSQIDIESPNAAQEFPDFKDKTAWVADLGPGDVLYIPMYWWHHVRSLSVSFSVSLWWKK